MWNGPLKIPGGTTKKSKADSNTAMCPVSSSSVIIPVYGQEGGKSITPIGLELTALAEGNAGDQPSKIVYQITGEGDAREVLLEVVPENGNGGTGQNDFGNHFWSGIPCQ